MADPEEQHLVVEEAEKGCVCGRFSNYVSQANFHSVFYFVILPFFIKSQTLIAFSSIPILCRMELAYSQDFCCLNSLCSLVSLSIPSYPSSNMRIICTLWWVYYFDNVKYLYILQWPWELFALIVAIFVICAYQFNQANFMVAAVSFSVNIAVVIFQYLIV